MVPAPTLEGTLVVLPSLRPDLLEAIAAEYERLLESYPATEILVLKRHPEGLGALEETLTAVDTPDRTPHRPQVESVPEHASKVIEEYDPQLDRLEYEERIALISMVIDGANASLTPYLERAREQDAFVRDVGQLLLEATRQRLDPADADHVSLEALYRINERYHEELADRGYVERPSIVPKAVEVLESNTRGVTDRVTDGYRAILTVEYQEFRSIDRRYLAALAADARLVCVGEPNASVERTRVEPGTLEDLAEGLDVIHRDRADHAGPAHAPLTRFLATGDSPSDGQINRIDAGTMRAQDRAIAAEIQSVIDRSDRSPGDIAVAVPGLDRVPPMRSRLRAAGLPTEVVGTAPLVENPVVHELFALVTLQTAESSGGFTRSDERSLARERLEARVRDVETLLETCIDDRVLASLERWIVQSDSRVGSPARLSGSTPANSSRASTAYCRWHRSWSRRTWSARTGPGSSACSAGRSSSMPHTSTRSRPRRPWVG
ncbi:MAG: hypothetical protein U5K37_10345 [Natrialbaceae archaeon]|nr:hypothetical protein [Natrialbaceae archaeon]